MLLRNMSIAGKISILKTVRHPSHFFSGRGHTEYTAAHRFIRTGVVFAFSLSRVFSVSLATVRRVLENHFRYVKVTAAHVGFLGNGEERLLV